jgi:hypothetical protein
MSVLMRMRQSRATPRGVKGSKTIGAICLLHSLGTNPAHNVFCQNFFKATVFPFCLPHFLAFPAF